jgi:hypothetical protein
MGHCGSSRIERGIRTGRPVHHTENELMTSQDVNDLLSALIVGLVAFVAFLALLLPLALGLFERRS